MFCLAFVLLRKFAIRPATIAIVRECVRLVFRTAAGISNIPESVVVQAGAYAIACTMAVERRIMEATGATVRIRTRHGPRPCLHAQGHHRIAELRRPAKHAE